VRSSAFIAAIALLFSSGADASVDPDNPTCPQRPDWGPTSSMSFTVAERDGKRVLLAEGAIDDALVPRLTAGLVRQRGN
jgi:hypothetical protein